MPTRRPKVPRPAATAKPAGDGSAARRPAAGTSGKAKPAASKTASASGTSKPAAKSGASKPSTANRPGKPAETGSAARAAIRSRLSGEIRREDGKGRDAGNTRAAEPAPDELRPVPAKAFSGRLLVLAMVMVAITVLLAPSVRTYLQQRSDIAAAKAEIAQAQEVQADLEVQLGRWEDPAYIKQQARDRIFLVMPGETRYLVKGENGVEEADRKAAEEAPEDLQWVDSLWDSVKRSATAQ